MTFFSHRRRRVHTNMRFWAVAVVTAAAFILKCVFGPPLPPSPPPLPFEDEK